MDRRLINYQGAVEMAKDLTKRIRAIKLDVNDSNFEASIGRLCDEGSELVEKVFGFTPTLWDQQHVFVSEPFAKMMTAAIDKMRKMEMLIDKDIIKRPEKYHLTNNDAEHLKSVYEKIDEKKVAKKAVSKKATVKKSTSKKTAK